ncbi:hypothetical protein MFMK1_001234 [Metallumcola ferriviriculae]|uniref:Beta-ketoacyl-[acyl-carrier-protein] synthase III C-terminal domain-containing protein n=1 Tax=Metallumcola ferriviriculae TaxID=3039180 RepID=A0AAU0UML4_9FIRM|nr:hypothetical protein MFMK1_001234 [Desulfitibacteraceae bacterium MK1]
MTKSIIAYGAYLPFLRIKRDEYISSLGSCTAAIKEKTVMDTDEDVVTMAVAAGRKAIRGIDAAEIGALALASSNFPYQEKLAAGTVMEALGLDNSILTGQHSGSTMAGSEAFMAALGLLDQSDKKYALVIISDAPATDAAQDMDHGLGAAACALLLAQDEPGLEFEGVSAHVTESLGLRYRLPGETNLRDIGVKAYGSQAYNNTMSSAITGLLNKLERKAADYKYAVLHQNDIKTAAGLAKKMGFKDEQLQKGVTYDRVGDSGACSPFLGVCTLMDSIGAGEKVIICSYGSGGGSQALSFTCTKQLAGKSFDDDEKRYIDYIQYLKIKKKL